MHSYTKIGCPSAKKLHPTRPLSRKRHFTALLRFRLARSRNVC